MRRREPSEVTVANPHPSDIPQLPGRIRDELAVLNESRETDFTDERKLLGDVEALLQRDGTPTTINGEPAIVTRTAYMVKDGEEKMYARPYVTGAGKPEEVFGIVFDHTENLQVDTLNVGLYQFVHSSDKSAVHVGSDPLAGNNGRDAQEMLELGQNAVRSIAAKLDDQDAKRAHDKEMSRRKFFRRAGFIVLGLGAASGAGYGGYRAYQTEFWRPYEDRFDENEFELPIEKSIGVGEMLVPAYSERLAQAPLDDKGIGDAPDTNTNRDDADDKDLTVEDGLRRIRFTGSAGNDKVVVIPLETPPPTGARLAAWTGYRALDGRPRNEEFNIFFLHDEIVAVWTGREIHLEDDPYVYIRMLPSG